MILFMQDATFITKPVPVWQRRFDALRAFFVDRPSTQLVAARMIADTLYSRLAQNLRGFQTCDAPKCPQGSVKGKAEVVIEDGAIGVISPRRAHNPILHAALWQQLPQKIPWLNNAPTNLDFPRQDRRLLYSCDAYPCRENRYLNVSMKTK